MTIFEEAPVLAAVGDGVATVTINRPHCNNAVTSDILISLQMVLEKIVSDGEARCVLLTATGGHVFSSGFDIPKIMNLGRRPIADFVDLGQQVMRSIELLPIPVIVLVGGLAQGAGLELVLASDIVIASERAQFGCDELRMGLIPGFGGMRRLIDRCGLGLARRLVYTGEIIDAQEALRFGLVDRAVEIGQLLISGREMAEAVSLNAPLAVKGAKEVFRRSLEQSQLASLRLEAEGFLSLYDTADREEGMQATMQRRAARFLGR